MSSHFFVDRSLIPQLGRIDLEKQERLGEFLAVAATSAPLRDLIFWPGITELVMGTQPQDAGCATVGALSCGHAGRGTAFCYECGKPTGD